MRTTIVENSFEFTKNLAERSETNVFIIHHVGDINREVTEEEIHQWHLNAGYSGIGYHYVIHKDGTIGRGRPRWASGAHCYGRNYDSIGINVVGDFMNNEPTYEQLASLVNLLADLHEIYELTHSEDTILGHRDILATDCPGDTLYNSLPIIREQVAAALW